MSPVVLAQEGTPDFPVLTALVLVPAVGALAVALIPRARAELHRGVGGRLRPLQSGFVRSYALGVTIGVVVVLGYFITRVSF